MKNKSAIKNIATQVLRQEAEAVQRLCEQIDDDFIAVVEGIAGIQGRVVITGIGKSAIIAQKIVATLNSTGTPSIFMHAADAIHGDLGIIQSGDLVIVISKSGNTPEIKVLVPLLRHGANKIVAMVGNRESYLAKHADYILDTSIEREACPFDLAPTTSTTVQLAMGDALAVCLIECRQFTDRDFARYHPGGALGKRLYLTVGDLSMQNGAPQVRTDSPIREVIVAITRHRLGAVAVTAESDVLAGIITDGDIRRMLENHSNIDQLSAGDIMGKNPKTISAETLAVQALEQMRTNNISQLLVVDSGQYQGVIHIHDLLREGII